MPVFVEPQGARVSEMQYVGLRAHRTVLLDDDAFGSLRAHAGALDEALESVAVAACPQPGPPRHPRQRTGASSRLQSSTRTGLVISQSISG